MKRRTFLAGCGVCGLGAALGVRACYYPGAGRYADLVSFSGRQGVVLAALVDAMLPPAADRTLLDEHVRAIDAFVVGLPEADRAQLGQCLDALEHGTLPFGGHLARFSALSHDDRADTLLAWQTSSIGLLRLGFRSLKALVFLAYYRTPASWAAIGYGGPVLPAPARQVIAERYTALAAPPGTRPRGRS
jgi:hypothetical protein